MVAKILLMPTSCSHHMELCADFEEMVLDSIASAGGDIRLYSGPHDMTDASCLLTIGVGNWGNAALREALLKAGERKIERIHWQMETLPPPDMPRSATSTFLLRRTPDRVRALSRFADKLALKLLSRQIEGCSWWTDGTMAPRQLGLPFREARRIRALWRDGLLDRIIVSMESRGHFLRSIGVDSTFVPLGYHPLWGRPIGSCERDLDVVFIGTPTSARRQLLDRMAKALGDEGFRLTVIEGDCYGERRTELLNRAKILIHPRNYPWELTRMRMLMAMGCKALVVTDQFEDTKPFRPGEHLAMAPRSMLIDTIIHYLRNDQARSVIAEHAYNFLSNELNMGKLLKTEIGF